MKHLRCYKITSTKMITLKLIWIQLCLFYLIFHIKTLNGIGLNDELFRKQIEDDLPKSADFEYYLTALEKIVNFCIRYRVYLDASMEFGLFLLDVNLKELSQEKRAGIPKALSSRLDKLLIKTRLLGEHFQKMVKNHDIEKSMAQDIKWTQLFYNKTKFPRKPDTFNKDLLKQTKIYSPQTLDEMYGTWDNYYTYVFDIKRYVPTPTDSDECIAQLASNPIHHQLYYQPTCTIPDSCKWALDKGSEYGYGLMHRTFLMVIARFARDCIVFSKKKDKFKTDTFCLMAFNEAEYIASNRFGLPDIMFEQMAFCGLLGHAQFFRNYWLKSLLQYQTKEGCFTQKLATGLFNENLLRAGPEDTWKMSNPTIIMNGQCEAHFTAVAAPALSNALRYIIETHY